MLWSPPVIAADMAAKSTRLDVTLPACKVRFTLRQCPAVQLSLLPQHQAPVLPGTVTGPIWSLDTHYR